jgi:5-methyltetrahydrofolate--homocysteine methyltransferase
MLHPLERIKRHEVLIADGAMGTMLFESGLNPGECPETVNLSRPELLEDIARAYWQAGADILHTNTFGASPLKLAEYNLHDQCHQINCAAILAARRGAADHTIISLSCGPSGRIPKPYGDTDPEELRQSYEKQLACTLSEPVDMITVETMTDLTEATIAVSSARQVAPDTPICATMTFDKTPRGFFTIMGVTIEQAAAELLQAGADIIGSNCGNGIENMVEIAAEFRKHTEAPLLIQANAGIPENKNGRLIYPESPEFMAERCRALPGLGVNIIGGCCGTTPEHIAAIRSILKQSDQ